MGRPRGFDQTDAVRSALSVFWDRGLDGAAIPDLEQATGLGRSSIYHAFGSKRGLFDASVTAYLDHVVRPRLAPLQTADVAPDALDAYLAGLRTAMVDPKLPLSAHGCLLLNTATSAAAADPALGDAVRAYRDELGEAIGRGVTAARPDLAADAQALLATACTAHVIAAMTLVRVDARGAVTFLDSARALLVSGP